MIHEELSREIIGAAMDVLNELKPYRGELIGNLIPDLIVDDAVIVDPKVVSCFTDTHVAQMIGYLNITRLDLALLPYFQECTIGMETSVAPSRT